MPESDLIVEAVGLEKTFTDFWMRARARAVDGIDFHIDRHEIFGLLGPNGSGKSTTIKMILGLLRKSRGRLLVFGRDPSDTAVKAKIGYLPEETYLYRFLNPVETLDYYGKLFGLDRRTRRRRTDELLDMVGLTQVAHRPMGEFSKGMARRLGLAQALVNDPELLILDEPTSGLDPLGTKQVKDLLLELGRRGKTILLSSHLLADVEDVCHRMVILYGGRVRAEGTGDELLADTTHTVLRTKRLKSETIQAIDALLHEREGIALEGVEAPRQSLEALFLEIVEKARLEHTDTSGARSGGDIAAFLRKGEDGAEGAAVVDLLVKASNEPARVAEVLNSSATNAAAVQDDVLRTLVDGTGKTPLKPETTFTRADANSGAGAKATPKSGVDRSLIDGLLGDSSKETDA